MMRVSTDKLAYLGLGTLLMLQLAAGCGKSSDDEDDAAGGGDDEDMSEVDGGAAGSDSAGEAGSGSVGSGMPDTGDFLQDCQQGGANWGTPQQAGPCASGISIYGVKSDFGPYGASTEHNVGAGFENTVSGLDSPAICGIFIDAFGADPIGSADLKDIHDLNLALYSVFYPGVMPEGEKFPLLTWGNGTCAMPEGYGPLLRHVASHGYIVVAANSRYVGSGEAQRKAIDFMFAQNDDPASKYYQKIDTTKVGAFGHSQGSGGTAMASTDERISTVILFNGGSQAGKPYLAVSGERDIGGAAATNLSNPVEAAQLPAAYIYYHHVPMTVAGQPTGGSAGHLTLMMEPERVNDPTVAWFDMMLKGDAEAKKMFVGADCTLCDGTAYPSMWDPGTPSLTYGHNALLE
jgi:hypothetical protein